MFSFIDAPNQALATLRRLVALSRDPKTETIFVDQAHCLQIDLGAEAVASVIGRAAVRKLGKTFKGYLPIDPEQMAIAKSVGFARNLGIEFDEDPDFLVFDFVDGAEIGDVEQTAAIGNVSTNLIKYIDRCLHLYGHSLNDDGRAELGHLVGEVVDNCVQHAGRDPAWYVTAYLHQHPEEGWGDCHIAIFNFGMSISESLQTLPPEARLRQDIQRLVDDHAQRKLFSFSAWQPEDLWTLYALQSRVSRRNTHADLVGDNGQGTADMIEAFQELSGDRVGRPKMAVVSGRTQVLFDGTYKMKESANRARIIAFNDENTLAERPRRQYVRHLKERFPGTLVSLRFFFDQEHLDDLSKRAATSGSWKVRSRRD